MSTKTLHEALTELMHESAEYDHPLDADAQDISKARGMISVHEIHELLEKHAVYRLNNHRSQNNG